MRKATPMPESNFEVIDYKGQKIVARQVKLANGQVQWRNRFNMALEDIDWIGDEPQELQQKASKKREARPKKKVANTEEKDG